MQHQLRRLIRIAKLGSIITAILFLGMQQKLSAQIDSLKNIKKIEIMHADSGIGQQQNIGYYNRLLGHVSIKHNDMTMLCDSAHFYLAENLILAYGDVDIQRAGGSFAKANYVRYNGNLNKAFMQTDVYINEDGRTLKTDELDYDLNTKVGIYQRGGTLNTDGTRVNSRYGKYNANTKQAYFKGNVIISSSQYDIESEEIYYNTANKKMNFTGKTYIYSDRTNIETNGGTFNEATGRTTFQGRTRVENEDQIITANKLNFNEKTGSGDAAGNVIIFNKKDDTELLSDFANFNDKTGKGRARGNVHFTDNRNLTKLTANTVDFDKESGDGKARGNVVYIDEVNNSILKGEKLDFNNKTNIGKAVGKVIYEDKQNARVLYADKANFDNANNSGDATGNVIIIDDVEQTKLYSNFTSFDNFSGYGLARGDVHFIDIKNESELYAGVVEYNKINDFVLAYERPILITVTDGDTLYIASDTLINLRNMDKPLLESRILVNEKMTFELLYEESEAMNFDESKLVISNINVKVFGDSLQAVCDSMSYNESDSVFRMYKNPIVWNTNQQASGDTIYLYTENSKVKRTEIIGRAFMISSSDYEDIYDQISGQNLTAYFTDGKIQMVNVDGNAQSLYYAKDEAEKYVGMNKALGARIKIYFEEKEVERIVFLDSPNGTFYPMSKIQASERYLDGFTWEKEKRPMSKADLLN